MAIYTGFYSAYESRSEAVKKAAKDRYDLLNAAQKEMFHNTIPPVLMAVGIGVLNAETCKAASYRLALACPSAFYDFAVYQHKVEKSDVKFGMHTHDYEAVERFFSVYDGLCSNVRHETDSEFFRRLKSMHGHLAPFNATKADKLADRTRKAFG